MQLIEKFIDPSKHKLKSPHTMVAEYITVHNTANDASADNEISYMQNNINATSFHIAVDDIKAIIGIPLNRNAYHCGDGAKGTGNLKSIGIEICYSRSGGARYTKAEENAVEVIAQLLHERKWGLERVKQHNHWSGKDCPHRIRAEKRWDSFLERIGVKLNQLKGETMMTFKDVPKTHSAYSEIERAKSLGLIGGYTDGTFKPNQAVTRAEVTILLTRLYDKLKG